MQYIVIYIKVNGWKKNTQLYFTILILGRVDLKSRRIVRDDRGRFKVVNGIVQQEDLTVLNVYATNYIPAKYLNAKQNKQKRRNRKIFYHI